MSRPRTGRGLIGPFPSPSGALGVLPRPLDPGPPQPEPEERWTLGPRPPQKPEEPADQAPEAAPEIELEHVRGTIHAAHAGEADAETDGS